MSLLLLFYMQSFWVWRLCTVTQSIIILFKAAPAWSNFGILAKFAEYRTERGGGGVGGGGVRLSQFSITASVPLPSFLCLTLSLSVSLSLTFFLSLSLSLVRKIHLHTAGTLSNQQRNKQIFSFLCICLWAPWGSLSKVFS